MTRTHLSLLVALHSGSFSGIDTYAEQVAVMAAARGHDVTILAVGGRTAQDVARRTERSTLRVIPTREFPMGRWSRTLRQLPTFAVAEMRELMSAALFESRSSFDVAHVNHPGLAPVARRVAGRVVAAAWFYPHGPVGRFAETWRHTGRLFPKSAALAVKGLGHYLNDRRGFGSCDIVAAPTERLAAQLRGMRIAAVACPPPAAPPAAAEPFDGDRAASSVWRITICCADLAHPRKNVRVGVQAAGHLARLGRPIELVLVGGNPGAHEATLAALPPSVRVLKTGRLPRGESQHWMANSDVLLLPSLYEEWGYVATEALMTGTPVAALPVYPFDEMLKPPLGICADDMTPHALAQAMERAIEGGRNRAVVRQAAADRFGLAAVGSRLNRLWADGEVPGVERGAPTGSAVLG